MGGHMPVLWRDRVRGYGRNGPTNDPNEEIVGGAVCNQCVFNPGDEEFRIRFSNDVFESGELYTRSQIVHELAHLWDYKGTRNSLSLGMVIATGGRIEPDGSYSRNPDGRTARGDYDLAPSNYAKGNRFEDFAESVAATIYPNAKWQPFQGSRHNQYIIERFNCGRAANVSC